MDFELRKEPHSSFQKLIIFIGYGAAEAPPGFQAGWSDCIYFFLSFVHLFAHL
jgi:hypothetical protein